MKKWLLTGLALVTLILAADSTSAPAATGNYSNEVYDNLQRTRDALLGQRDELQRAHADILAQIDRLNTKLSRIEQYQKQVDNSIHDVDDALNKF